MDRAAARIQGHVRHCSQKRFYAETGQHQCDRMKGRVSYHSEPPKDPKNGLTAKGMYELQVWCSLQQLLRQLEPWFDEGCGGFRLGYSSTAGLRYSTPPDESGRRYTIRVFNITWDDRHERYEKREKDHDLLCCEKVSPSGVSTARGHGQDSSQGWCVGVVYGSAYTASVSHRRVITSCLWRRCVCGVVVYGAACLFSTKLSIYLPSAAEPVKRGLEADAGGARREAFELAPG
eukprot:scaffold35697_cov51-Phaeocystis_antarctica.AAC.1